MFEQVKLSASREIGKSFSILSGPIAITADPIQCCSCKYDKKRINKFS